MFSSVLISSTCTLLGTPSFPQYISLSVSSCVCWFVRKSTSVLALSHSKPFQSVSSLAILCLSSTSASVLPLSVVQVPSPATVSVCLAPTHVCPDFNSACSSEPRLRLPGSDPRLSHDHRTWTALNIPVCRQRPLPVWPRTACNKAPVLKLPESGLAFGSSVRNPWQNLSSVKQIYFRILNIIWEGFSFHMSHFWNQFIN